MNKQQYRRLVVAARRAPWSDRGSDAGRSAVRRAATRMGVSSRLLEDAAVLSAAYWWPRPLNSRSEARRAALLYAAMEAPTIP
jgi:hypothetical protein